MCLERCCPICIHYCCTLESNNALIEPRYTGQNNYVVIMNKPTEVLAIANQVCRALDLGLGLVVCEVDLDLVRLAWLET